MADALKDDNRMVFAVGQTATLPIIIMGITKKSFDYLMAGDNYQMFDFTRQGVPTYMVVIAGKTRAHVLDKVSPMMSGPVIADMHSANVIPQDEQAIPKMRARARAFTVTKNGAPYKPVWHLSDDELDAFCKAVLGAEDGP